VVAAFLALAPPMYARDGGGRGGGRGQHFAGRAHGLGGHAGRAFYAARGGRWGGGGHWGGSYWSPWYGYSGHGLGYYGLGYGYPPVIGTNT
jgi:hypothetical protein